MGAIGGIFNFKNDNIDVSMLDKMRKSMLLRGRRGSSAFLGGSSGTFFCSSVEDIEEKQPYICERNGHSFALCIDCGQALCSSIMEGYFKHGEDIFGSLVGSFSLSLYDGEKKRLILARDRQGRRPLFYKIISDKVLFASEVKGLALDGPLSIDREALSSHLTAPAGRYGAEDIYNDVDSVRAGECVIFDRLGYRKHFFTCKKGIERIYLNAPFSEKEAEAIYPSLDLSGLGEYITSSLLAFDYPQFDLYMPSLMDVLDSSSGRILFEDGARAMSLRYAYERQDRLGGLYGVDIIGVSPSKKIKFSLDELRLFENALLERLGNGEGVIRYVLGDIKYSCVFDFLFGKNKKIEDTEISIRILGMLCQLIEWSEAEHLVIGNYPCSQL